MSVSSGVLLSRLEAPVAPSHAFRFSHLASASPRCHLSSRPFPQIINNRGWGKVDAQDFQCRLVSDFLQSKSFGDRSATWILEIYLSSLYSWHGAETNMPPVYNYFANSCVATCERPARAGGRRSVDVGGVPLPLPAYFGGRSC